MVSTRRNIFLRVSGFVLWKIITANSLISNKIPISRIAILTSGGDCPGINACIRAILKSAQARGIEVLGLPRGLPGLLYEPPVAFSLDDAYSSADMLKKGGSRLGGFISSDFKVFDSLSLDEKAARISQSISNLGINGIIATGGDKSFSYIAELLQHTEHSIPFIGIPKTIDNDIPMCFYSIGFQSAVSTASKAIAGIRDTAESHRRIMVVECMGRKSGYLTLHAGIAGGADTILLPEFPIDEEDLLNHVQNVYDVHKCAVVAVSESITLPRTNSISTYETADGRLRLGGSAEVIARLLSEKLSKDARHVVLGHTQRGGSPNAFDQILSTVLGTKAIDALCHGVSNVIVTRNGNSVEAIPLEEFRNKESGSLTADSPEVLAALSIGIYIGETK